MRRFRNALLTAVTAVSLCAVPTAGSAHSLGRTSVQQTVHHLFGLATSVALDRQRNIYVSDACRQDVVKLSPAGKPEKTLLSQSGFLTDLVVDAHNHLYVVAEHPDSSEIIEASTAGKILNQWLIFPGPHRSELFSIGGIALDARGNVYVVEWGGNRVQKYTPKGKLLATWGSVGRGPSPSEQGHAIAVDATGNVYVTDLMKNSIRKLSSRGRQLKRWGSLGTAPGQFDEPAGIAVDSAGNVYVADRLNNRIQKLAPDPASGALVPMAQWGSFGHDPGQFDAPVGIALDSQGNIYVVDTDNRRIQKLSPQGRVLAVWSTTSSGSSQTHRVSSRTAPRDRPHAEACPIGD